MSKRVIGLDIVGISYGCLKSRITKLGMSLEEATKITKDLRYKPIKEENKLEW